MNAEMPICVQIAALGGQGGGVLAEWLAEAAHIGGYPAQVTSIPGVAQRTGATTYYFEMYGQKNPQEKPIFCLFPDADGLDLMIAMEPLEAVRALDLGLITERTTVLTATRRIYSTAEKSVAGDGAFSSDVLYEALEGAAKSVVKMDIDALSAKPGAPGNAVMFGAIAASRVLPFDQQDFQQAIRVKGIAVEANLIDFAGGFNHAPTSEDTVCSNDTMEFELAPVAFAAEIEALPAPVRPLAGHACTRLLDYQNEGYGRLFLNRLQPFAAMDAELTSEVAQRLAAWMTYEDVIRVAQLKTRKGRLARIRREVGVDEAAPLSVTEFLKPGREEFASLLPPELGRKVMRGHNPSSSAGLPIRLPTTTVFGYGALKLLASLKGWRPRTYRYELEQDAIEQWLRAVEETSKVDANLALRTAKLAVLARGYGGVRIRGLDKLNMLLRDWNRKLKHDLPTLSTDVDTLLHHAHHDPDQGCGKTD